MPELVFIYNAKSGKIHSAIDSLHKFLSPATYTCDLCRLTHGTFRMKKAFREVLDKFESVKFLHKNENGKYPAGPELPCVIYDNKIILEKPDMQSMSEEDLLRKLQELLSYP